MVLAEVMEIVNPVTLPPKYAIWELLSVAVMVVELRRIVEEVTGPPNRMTAILAPDVDIVAEVSDMSHSDTDAGRLKTCDAGDDVKVADATDRTKPFTVAVVKVTLLYFPPSR
jgi:hypothetical protein